MGSAGFQYIVKVFDVILSELVVDGVDDMVYGSKMVCRLYDIINVYFILGNSYCVSFKYIPCLVMSQSAAFYVIGVVGQFDLHAMIDSTLQSSIFLVDKGFE